MAESYRDGIRRGVQAVRTEWPQVAPGRPVPLAEAHQLLRDDEVESVVQTGLIKLGRKFGVIGLLQSDDGMCVIPSPERFLPLLHTETWKALLAGRLVAKGLDPDDAAHGKALVIPANRWSILTPDWERSAATCDGKVVAVGITAKAAEIAIEKPAPKPISDVELHEWVARYSRQGGAPNERAIWQAAKVEFGERVTRARIRALPGGRRRRPGRPLKIMRRENAPEN